MGDKLLSEPMVAMFNDAYITDAYVHHLASMS